MGERQQITVDYVVPTLYFGDIWLTKENQEFIIAIKNHNLIKVKDIIDKGIIREDQGDVMLLAVENADVKMLSLLDRYGFSSNTNLNSITNLALKYHHDDIYYYLIHRYRGNLLAPKIINKMALYHYLIR